MLPERTPGNPLLGIVAFVLALLIFVALPVAMIVVNQPAFLDQASVISGRVVAAQLIAMIVTSGLGIFAVITRRGRSWGIAALALLVGLLLIGLVQPLIFSLGGGGSTPVL